MALDPSQPDQVFAAPSCARIESREASIRERLRTLRKKENIRCGRLMSNNPPKTDVCFSEIPFGQSLPPDPIDP